MITIGADYHPGFQQIAFVDTDTGEFQERPLQHREEAEKFYRELAAQGIKVRVGMEASGHARWLERLLAELNFELWIGDAAEIQSKRVRRQRRIGRMLGSCCACCWKIVFRGSGCRAGKIAIYGNCFGIGTAWCRRAPGS